MAVSEGLQGARVREARSFPQPATPRHGLDAPAVTQCYDLVTAAALCQRSVVEARHHCRLLQATRVLATMGDHVFRKRRRPHRSARAVMMGLVLSALYLPDLYSLMKDSAQSYVLFGPSVSGSMSLKRDFAGAPECLGLAVRITAMGVA